MATARPGDIGPATAMTRREFVAGVLAGSASVLAGAVLAPTASAQPKPHRIDLHHHIAGSSYVETVRNAKLGSPPLYNWSVQKSLDDMDKAGVATAVTSVSQPAVAFLDEDNAKRLARECNEYAATLRSEHPGRYGIFATLPMPHIEASLHEIAYALDTLKADGICLMTSYGTKWLGASEFTPVMEELNRRQALVYTHPNTPDCCRNLVPDIPQQIIEFGTDTTRTIANLVFSGASTRFPNVRFIFSHAGGTMPFLLERFQVLPNISAKLREAWTSEKVTAELKRFNYDTAQSAHAGALGALRQLVPVSQIVFGSDFPFSRAAENVKGLQAFFAPEELRTIERDNAVKLIPRLGA